MTAEISVREFDDDPGAWNRWVETAQDARFCHRYEWLQLVRDVYGGEPHYLAARRDGAIVGALAMMLRSVIGEGRVLISVPLADEGAVLAADDDAEEALLNRSFELVEELNASRLELRQRRPAPGTEADLSRVNMEMDLPDDPDALWDSFKSKLRNKTRKAGREGLAAHRADDLHAAISDSFYPVYCENTRDLGSPMHSERFFHEVADRFPDASEIMVVRDGDTAVGAGYAIRWRERFAVPWASSLRRYFKQRPNNMLYWELMRLAIESGCSVFDFGRSPKDSGTYKFKEQWGAEPVQLHYCNYGNAATPADTDNRERLAYRMFSSMWQRMPLPIARVVGPKIFARLPI
ncbi:MAG: FemAB family PEP-CTERM system-associated protein [Armatimonadota bacterium]